MKIKTSELIGAQLDWAVAKALDYKPALQDDECGADYWICQVPWGGMAEVGAGFIPSIDWGQGGPLIEKHMVVCDYGRPLAESEKPLWFAQVWKPYAGMTGSTPLIAAMRAIVAAKLGEEIEVPEELA